MLQMYWNLQASLDLLLWRAGRTFCSRNRRQSPDREMARWPCQKDGAIRATLRKLALCTGLLKLSGMRTALAVEVGC